MLQVASGSAAEDNTVLFLVDGSGSVTQGDFDVMKTFIGQAVGSISKASADSKVSISVPLLCRYLGGSYSQLQIVRFLCVSSH